MNKFEETDYLIYDAPTDKKMTFYPEKTLDNNLFYRASEEILFHNLNKIFYRNEYLPPCIFCKHWGNNKNYDCAEISPYQPAFLKKCKKRSIYRYGYNTCADFSPSVFCYSNIKLY